MLTCDCVMLMGKKQTPPPPVSALARERQIAAEQAKGPGWAARLARAGAPLTPKERAQLLRASNVYPYGES